MTKHAHYGRQMLVTRIVGDGKQVSEMKIVGDGR